MLIDSMEFQMLDYFNLLDRKECNVGIDVEIWHEWLRDR